jgi:NhaA family Na+:H+ antiporter
VLLACTLAALAWANSPWADAYDRLAHTTISIGVGGAILACRSSTGSTTG